MNTPRTKKPKRWEHIVNANAVSGGYVLALAEPSYLQALGKIISMWPHIEEMMMSLFAEFLGVLPHDVNLRLIYRSIISANTRIDIMQNLLEQGISNQSKGIEYDEIMDEFKKLNSIRNQYAHGLWSTHESGKIFLAVSSMDNFWIMKENREIKVKEITDTIERINNFEKRTREIIGRDITTRLAARTAQKS